MHRCIYDLDGWCEKHALCNDRCMGNGMVVSDSVVLKASANAAPTYRIFTTKSRSSKLRAKKAVSAGVC